MATVFKTFLNDDVVTSRTLLHEAIPITGSLVVSLPEGAYDDPSSPASNVKTYPHGMFQSVYDYPYASSSANHIFDVTVGVFPEAEDLVAGNSDSYTGNYNPSVDPWAAKKRNIHNQMAQVLVGHDTEGNILKFDQDGDFASGGVKYTDVFFINIARLIAKDEIRKGSFQMTFGIGQPILLHDANGDGFDSGGGAIPLGGHTDPATKNDQYTDIQPEPDLNTYITIGDEGAATDYRVNSPAGEYGILKVTGLKYLVDDGAGSTTFEEQTGEDVLSKYEDTNGETPDAIRVGLIYYQAGIVVLDRSLFAIGKDTGAPNNLTQYPLPVDLTDAANLNAAKDICGIIPHDAVCLALDANAGAAAWYSNHTAADQRLYTYGSTGANGATNTHTGDGGVHWSADDRAMLDFSAGGVAYAPGPNVNVADWNAVAVGETTAFGSVDQALRNGSIDQIATGLRGRITDIAFNNTTELNSTIYFCRVNHNDFNYSSNPTYLGGEDNSKIRVKRQSLDAPVSYVTTIGLYSADNELLAVAKLSEPLRKDPTNEMTLRVRLDY